VRLGITCVFAPLLILGGIVLMRRYWRSKALIYRTVGAQITMQKMCEKLFIAQSLMIFELQLAASSLILWLRNGVEDWTPEEVVVVSIGTVVTILWLILGYLAYIRDANDELLQNSVFVSGGLKQKGIT
ncbi:unnamed protein product, partial [Oppiella nova]